MLCLRCLPKKNMDGVHHVLCCFWAKRNCLRWKALFSMPVSLYNFYMPFFLFVWFHVLKWEGAVDLRTCKQWYLFVFTVFLLKTKKVKDQGGLIFVLLLPWVTFPSADLNCRHRQVGKKGRANSASKPLESFFSLHFMQKKLCLVAV